ncbi:MAG: carbon storage regulator [Gammaproteobacteria bacterium]
MLVIGRCKGESIIINDEITISLISSNKSRAVIGIDAPNSVTIFRKEVYKKNLTDSSEKNNSKNHIQGES